MTPVRTFLKQHGISALAASLFALINSWPLISPSRLIAGFDTIAYTLPLQKVAADAMRRGRLPLWNPYLFGGAPHLANPQVGALYPLKWPFIFLPAHRAMMLVIALHLVILAVGMVVLLGGVLRLKTPAPLVGAIVMIGSGVVMAKSAAHYEQIITLAWGPLLLAATEMTVAGRFSTRGRGIAAMGTVTALMLLAGHQQPAYMLLCLAMLWAVVRSVELRRVASLAWIAAGLFTGAAAAAIQLVPAYLLVSESVRGLGLTLDYLSVPAYLLDPKGLATGLLGDIFSPSATSSTGGVEASLFIGAAAAVLAAAGFICGIRSSRHRITVITLATVALVSVVLALGPRTALYQLMFDFAPGFNLFRVPGRWVLVADMALAILVAFGVHSIASRELKRLDLALVGGTGLLAAAILGSGLFQLPGPKTVLSWVAIAAVTYGLVSMSHRGRHTHIITAALIAIPLLELGAISMHSTMREVASLPSDYSFDSPAIAFLQRNPGTILSITADELGDPDYLLRTLRPNMNSTIQIRSLDGYDGGPWLTQRWVDAMKALTGGTFNPDLTLRAQIAQPLDAEALAMFGVRWILLDADRFDPDAFVPGWGEPLALDDAVGVWKNPAYRGEAFLGGANTGEPIRLKRPRPEAFEAQVDARDEGTLVITEQWDAGWQAEVDGRAAEVEPVDGSLLGVAVPSGKHTVRLTYRAPGLALGAGITASAIVAMLLLGTGLLSKRRRPTTGDG